MFDVVFLYNQEKNGKKNYKRLLKAAPWAQCVKNAPSISSAHHQAAQIAKTEWFFTVDGDNFVLNDEIFYEKIFWKKCWHLRAVGVFRAKNPTNKAVYGWGGIKFWNKMLLREIPKDYQDFTTSFPMYVINDVASCHDYNVSSWDTWRSVFREVFKLMMKHDEESKQRLKLWLDPYDCFDFKDEYLNACVWAWEWIKKFKTLAVKNHNNAQKINVFSNIDMEFINSSMQALKQKHMRSRNNIAHHYFANDNFEEKEFNVNSWDFLKKQYDIAFVRTFNNS